MVQVRKTKKKRNYYICENNPKSCDYISWNKPKPGEKYVEGQEDMSEVSGETKKKTTKRSSTKGKTGTTTKSKSSSTVKKGAKTTKKTATKKTTSKK